MPKQLFVWIVLYFGGLAAAVIHPIYPLVSYLTFYYAPPHFNWWGDMLPDLRFSMLASVVMVLAAGLKSSTLERVSDARNPALRWLLWFGLNAVIVTVWAEDRIRSWGFAVVIWKLVFLYALMPVVIRTPAQFDLFSGVHIAGAAYWGYKGWDDPKREAGRLKEVGGPDTQNENAAAAHLLTVLPFIAVYAYSLKRRGAQAVVLLCGGFIINLLILCNSRGATVGLIAMAAAAIAVAGRGRRLKLLAVGALCLASLYFLADPQFIRRQQTTMDADDGSAQGRLEAGEPVLRSSGTIRWAPAGVAFTF
jgi:hypothetical protein